MGARPRLIPPTGASHPHGRLEHKGASPGMTLGLPGALPALSHQPSRTTSAWPASAPTRRLKEITTTPALKLKVLRIVLPAHSTFTCLGAAVGLSVISVTARRPARTLSSFRCAAPSRDWRRLPQPSGPVKKPLKFSGVWRGVRRSAWRGPSYSQPDSASSNDHDDIARA